MINNWNRIATLLNADGTPHQQWPTPLGVEYSALGFPTRSFMATYAIWTRRTLLEKLIIAFYDSDSELPNYALSMFTAHPHLVITLVPEYITPTEVIDTGYELYRDKYPLTDIGLSEIPPSLTGEEEDIDARLGRGALEEDD